MTTMKHHPVTRSSVLLGILVLATALPPRTADPAAHAVSWGAPSLAAQAAENVDGDLLRNPPDGEWLTNGRDLGETHFSPLDEIHTGNVNRLGLAWSWEFEGDRGQLEASPVVHDGVMYATGTWSVVFALDARTGEELWSWDPAIVQGGIENGGPSICCGPVNRGVALYRGKVYAGLLDGRLVALDADDGRPVWVAQTTPVGVDYSVTQAPRIVNGNVIIGNSGAEYGVRGYVSAYDAETGELAWRTYTVPGNPAEGFESPAMEMAAETWSGDWWELGGGGTVWDGMAFDPELNLLYVGTGNGAPWSREHRSAGQGDNLFLSSILALDADDGSIVWHYQTTPGDDWDYTAVQNLVLAEIPVRGETRRVIMQAPKNGFFYVLDRETGEFISAEKIGYANWASHVDPETGRPVETPEARYDATGAWLAPGPRGVHNWYPMSWNPGVGLVYVPAQNNQSFYRRSTDFDPQPGRFNLGTGGRGSAAGEEPPIDGPEGFLIAWDPVEQREIWRHDFETDRNGGTLTTGGNLVFSGREDGWFYAWDAASGEKLWEAPIAPNPGAVVSYSLDGRQYVTVLSGLGDDVAPGRVYTFGLDGDAPLPDAGR